MSISRICKSNYWLNIFKMSGNNPRRNGEKEILSRSQLLERDHPEIFTAAPRPGGFIKYLVPSKSQDRITIDESSTRGDRTDAESFTSRSIGKRPSKPYSDKSLNFSKQHRVSWASEVIHEYDVAKDADEDDTRFELSEDQDTSQELNSRLNMIAVRTLQAILLLASGERVKDDMMIISYLFLKNVKDEDGRIAPNCHRMVNHLRSMGVEKTLEDYDLDDDGKNVPPERRHVKAAKIGMQSSKDSTDDKVQREENEINTYEMQDDSRNKSATPQRGDQSPTKSGIPVRESSNRASKSNTRDSKDSGSPPPSPATTGQKMRQRKNNYS